MLMLLTAHLSYRQRLKLQWCNPMNKENMLKGVSKKIQLKKERIAMSNIKNVTVAQSIEAKYNTKMKAAGL